MLHTYRASHSTFLRAPVLEAVPGIVHAFSTRRGTGDLMTAAGMAGWPVAKLHQIHSNIVHKVLDNGFANDAPQGDATYTGLQGLALGVVTADCCPILVAERSGRAIAAIHAGWRGTSEGVARRTIDGMVAELGLDPSALVAVIGPHIGACCMEVGEEVVEWFQDPTVFERRDAWPRPHLNLAQANEKQLRGAGIPDEAIDVSGLCTRCRGDLFHSWRRDGSSAGRMLSVIGIEAAGEDMRPDLLGS